MKLPRFPKKVVEAVYKTVLERIRRRKR